MNVNIKFPFGKITGTVGLPASKSISNRVLMINALTDSDTEIQNIAVCDDTDSMQSVLQSSGNRFDVGHAGTAMRFLTAYLSRIVGQWEITGSERMKQRPIGVLVDALNKLGAKIEYIEQQGYPPLRIHGAFLSGGSLEIEASVSSQYISALMMIAPYMLNGLKIVLAGKVVSRTYLDMTIQIMQEFGAEVEIAEQTITIAPKPYHPVPYKVEADWSAASYFYELLAVCGGGEIHLPGLKQESTQGDAGQVAVWKELGVHTRFEKEGVVITFVPSELCCLEYDFVKMPDLVQSFAVACCLRGIPFVFSGVETLRIKETDRIAALINELAKSGFKLKAVGDGQLVWDGERCEAVYSPEIATYHDHRMAMAFAPVALKFPGLKIQDCGVVTKSFPDYWEQLQKLGAVMENKNI